MRSESPSWKTNEAWPVSLLQSLKYSWCGTTTERLLDVFSKGRSSLLFASLPNTEVPAGSPIAYRVAPSPSLKTSAGTGELGTVRKLFTPPKP